MSKHKCFRLQLFAQWTCYALIVSCRSPVCFTAESQSLICIGAKDTNCSTRLETRTKEFNSYASRSIYVVLNARGEAKAIREMCVSWLCALHLWPTRYTLVNSRSVLFTLLWTVCGRAEEHLCWDPKDGELCSGMVKPGEILVEACVVRNWRANRYRLIRV